MLEQFSLDLTSGKFGQKMPYVRLLTKAQVYVCLSVCPHHRLEERLATCASHSTADASSQIERTADTQPT